MIYTVTLSPEHLDLALRAIGKCEYEQVAELMDIIRVQVAVQNALALAREVEMDDESVTKAKMN